MPSDTERSVSIGKFGAVTSAMLALERSPLGALGFRAGIPTPLYRLNFGDNHDRLIRVPGALWHVLASLSERRNKLLQWASDICQLSLCPTLGRYTEQLRFILRSTCGNVTGKHRRTPRLCLPRSVQEADVQQMRNAA